MWRHHPPQNQFSVAFWRICFLFKNREFAAEYSVFRKLCRHLAIFRKTNNRWFSALLVPKLFLSDRTETPSLACSHDTSLPFKEFSMTMTRLLAKVFQVCVECFEKFTLAHSFKSSFWQSTLIMATNGEWVELFRNEGDADPYVVAQATTVFMPEISPNPVVFTFQQRVQVFCLGVQYQSLQPWVDWEGEHPQFAGYICKVCVYETFQGKSNSPIWSNYGKVRELTFDPLTWILEDGSKILRYKPV